MRIAIGSDHAGFNVKEEIALHLKNGGHEVLDVGTRNNQEQVDFPDYARAVGELLQKGKAERGILVCGSGVGTCIAANKLRGIRAAVCHDIYSAHQGVEHDDMNVLCLGSRVVGSALALELVQAFLSAKYYNKEPFIRRMKKVNDMEKQSI